MGKMPRLSVTSSSEDGNGGLPTRPPLLLCSLLQAKPINSENLLHVVIRALQSLKNLFLSVPLLNQFRPICVFPKTKLQSLQDTALQKPLPRLRLQSQLCWSGWNKTLSLSQSPVSMASAGSCCCGIAGAIDTMSSVSSRSEGSACR